MADKKQVDDTTPLVGELDIPSNFESILPDYPVKVADFNGPLDLLIYLIKKNQVDIYDIPIVLITNQYLEYLELMQELNQSVLKRSREYPAIRLPSKVVPIETRIQELVDKLASGGACGFNELFPDASSRQELITTFLAVLEMIRLKLIRVFQQGARGPIRVYARTRSDDDSRRSGTSIRDESAMRKTTEKDGAGL